MAALPIPHVLIEVQEHFNDLVVGDLRSWCLRTYRIESDPVNAGQPIRDQSGLVLHRKNAYRQRISQPSSCLELPIEMIRLKVPINDWTTSDKTEDPSLPPVVIMVKTFKQKGETWH